MDAIKDKQTDTSYRLLEVDMLAGACVLLALAVGAAVALTGKQNHPADTPVYYPITYEAPVTEDEPVQVAPLLPLPNPIETKPVKQLPNSGPGFITLMGDGTIPQNFRASKTDGVQDFYGGRWAPENIVSTADGTQMIIRKENRPNSPFSMPEMRTNKRHGYGRYEAIIQTGGGSGLITAFFTYTGPHVGNPHDEIDIEFVGKNSDTVSFNYWHKGKHGADATFTLPFDASAAPHLYAFEWQPKKITWYIDGDAYYSTAINDPQIPQTAGNIYFSLWSGIPAMQAWHGRPDFESGTKAIISCTSFTPIGETGRSCADVDRTS